jgi:hypothetical protein
MAIQQWTVTQIVEQALGRFENRPSNKGKFDPRMEFFLGLDECCQEKHYWWRRKAFSFQTAINQKTYDLSLPGVGNANAPDLVEIEEMFVVNSNPQDFPGRVPPELSAMDLVASIYGNAVQGLIPQNGYYLNQTGWQQLSLALLPSQVFTIAATYWAVPMITDTTQETIPLVPPNLQWGLLYMLGKRFAEFLYEEDDPRFKIYEKRYEEWKLQAAKSKQFSSQEAIAAKSNKQAVHAGGRFWGTGNR